MSNTLSLKNKTVIVTGHTSMVGRACVDVLRSRGAYVPTYWKWHRKDYPEDECYNLLFGEQAFDLLMSYKPDFVIHAAGYNGGLAMNLREPATIFYRTTLMALNVLKAAAAMKCEKVVSLISSCAYPDLGDEVMTEDKFWDGKCNETVECHGLAKRNLIAFGRQLNRETGNRFVSLTLQNCYGPYDRFNENGKVVSGLIQKFVAAKRANQPAVECWGTGKPLRELVFSPDAGECIVQALEKYDDYQETLNITSELEVSIFDLVNIVKGVVGYNGEVVWRTDKTDGQMRKALSAEKMNKYITHSFTPLVEGIEKTVEWYLASLGEKNV